MKVTTVRFGADLWRLLEAEAALAGVSVSQYIREAALARASAAVALRGEDPLMLLAGGTGAADVQQPVVQHARKERNTVTALRHRTAHTQSEASATRAEAEQAIRHAHEVIARSGEVLKQRR